MAPVLTFSRPFGNFTLHGSPFVLCSDKCADCATRACLSRRCPKLSSLRRTSLCLRSGLSRNQRNCRGVTSEPLLTCGSAAQAPRVSVASRSLATLTQKRIAVWLADSTNDGVADIAALQHHRRGQCRRNALDTSIRSMLPKLSKIEERDVDVLPLYCFDRLGGIRRRGKT